MKNLVEELYSREFKPANLGVRCIYNLIGKVLTAGMKCKYTYIDDPRKETRPCIIIQNHLSRLDHLFISMGLFPMKFTFMVAYNEFFREGQSFFLKAFRCIPKKNSVKDTTALKILLKYVRAGNSIVIAPEGFTSVDGKNHPVDVGSGKLLKKLNMPVYFADIKGQYLNAPKYCVENRIGKCEVTYSKLWEPEDLDAMSDSEVEGKLNELFRHDEYEWNKEKKYFYKSKSIIKDMEDLCYKCPNCGSLFTMHTHDNTIECEKCGVKATMGNYYQLSSDNSKIPSSPSAWSDYERIEIIKEIRKNKDFKYEENVKIGVLPTDHIIKGGGTSEIAGNGKLIIDHEGLHYIGTINNEDSRIDLNYEEFHTVLGSTDFSYFFIYKNGVYYDLFPQEHHSSYHIMLLVEEMHRLHVNSYKCFPWDEWMYKE